MTHSPQPTERFAQHSRLAELVTALGLRRYPLFLTGLLYEEPGGRLRRVAAVVSRDGDLVAYDAGEVVELAGHLGHDRRRVDRAFQRRLEGRQFAVALERADAGEQLVEDEAERVDVAPRGVLKFQHDQRLPLYALREILGDLCG